jgi:hypothetical protein
MLKFNDDDHDGEEDVDDRRRVRGNSKARNPSHPTSLDLHHQGGSKVRELEFLQSERGCAVVELHDDRLDLHHQGGSKVRELEFVQSERGCAVVELHDDVMPGDVFLIAWPQDRDEIKDDI